MNWGEAKCLVSDSDLYTPHTKLLDLSFSGLFFMFFVVGVVRGGGGDDSSQY